MPKKKKDTFFVVTYREPKEDKIHTLKAGLVTDSTLGLSFVCISDFIFETNGVVVDPNEEALSKKFENVKSLHLSIYSVISIEEVGQEHKGLKFKQDKNNLVVLPSSKENTKST